MYVVIRFKDICQYVSWSVGSDANSLGYQQVKVLCVPPQSRCGPHVLSNEWFRHHREGTAGTSGSNFIVQEDSGNQKTEKGEAKP